MTEAASEIDFEKAEAWARFTAKFYDSAHLQVVTGLTWSTIVAMEAAGTFPKRTDRPDDVWDRVAVDAWLKDRKP
jgi:hypothetical protein